MNGFVSNGLALLAVLAAMAAAPVAVWSQDRLGSLPDLALEPPRIITAPGREYAKAARGAQGVAAIERSPQGRLWASWYTGKSPRGVESPSSYVVLATSGDEGRTWIDPVLVIQAQPRVHTYDPCLWIDPSGTLWFFWAQSAGLQDGRMGVWAITTEEHHAERPRWSEPRRICNGIMLNKPTVLRNGDWLLPVGLWRDSTNVPNIALSPEFLQPYTEAMLIHDLGEERGSNVFRSRDAGKTFARIGQVRAPGTRVDEHMIVERGDGSLWMLIRNTGGMMQSVSRDSGSTWSEPSLFMSGGKTASKRFFLRRLHSGALLLVRNDAPEGGKRSHLTAFVSDDDGATWQGGLLLDERESSYPDGVQSVGGAIYLIYDHQRYTLNRANEKGVGGVMLGVFTEADVRAGKPMSKEARLKVVISQLRED